MTPIYVSEIVDNHCPIRNIIWKIRIEPTLALGCENVFRWPLVNVWLLQACIVLFGMMCHPSSQFSGCSEDCFFSTMFLDFSNELVTGQWGRGRGSLCWFRAAADGSMCISASFLAMCPPSYKRDVPNSIFPFSLDSKTRTKKWNRSNFTGLNMSKK